VRPRATGPFETHEELVKEVIERKQRGWNTNRICVRFDVTHPAINRIFKENLNERAEQSPSTNQLSHAAK
jgi:hypothetical protein